MKYVLFVCTHNAGRSQMAQAFFERHAPPDIRAESAGQEPADEVWPEVVEAMREIGIDLSDRRPKKLTVEMQLHADWAITLACGAQCPYVPSTVEDWDIPDPAGKPLEEVRAIRDAVEGRVMDLIDTRLDAIRADSTSSPDAAPAAASGPRQRVRRHALGRRDPRLRGRDPVPSTTRCRCARS